MLLSTQRRVAAFVAVAAFSAVLCSPAAAAPRAYVTFGMDGASQSQFDARTLFTSRGMRATYYASSGKAGHGTAVPWAALHQLAAEGHEIGGYGLDGVRLDGLSTDEQRRQVCADRQTLVAQGFNPVSFAWPFGKVAPSATEFISGCGYRDARTTQVPDGRTSEVARPAQPFTTRAVTLRAPMPIGLMKAYVQRAERTPGGWVQFVVGQVCDNCEYWSISQRRLGLFLDWLKRRADRGTVVEPAGAVLGYMPRIDHGRPQVAFMTPKRGKVIRSGRRTVLQVRATDDMNVLHVSFSVDGHRVGADRKAPYRVRWTARRGTHRLTATAVDTSGKTRRATVRVRVR